MNDQALVERLRNLPTGNLCNAHLQVRAMEAAIVPLFKGARLAGPATTAKVQPGQNAAIHRALIAAAPGQVLVIDGGGSRDFGPFGDILATACQEKGLAGLVIDGTVRDVAEIRAMEFPVFCLGANPSATEKTDPGEIGLPVQCAGVRVAPGDFVVGDADGVVVVPQAIASEAVAAAGEIVGREAEIRSELAAGKSTCEIFGIPV